MKQESISGYTALNPIQNRRGQSVVEFTLILIVTISLLFLSKGMFKGMSDFIDKYMGDYVACLMEYGELPSLGVQNTALKNHKGAGSGKVCEAKFQMAEISGGSGGGASSGRNSNSSNSSSSSNKDSSRNASKGSSNSADASSNSNSSSRGRGGVRSGPADGSKSRGVSSSESGFATADGPSAASSKVRIIEEEESSETAKQGRTLGNQRSSRSALNRPAYRAIQGRMGAEIEKSIRKSARAPSSKILDASEGGYRFRPYKKTFTPPSTVAPEQNDKDEGFSFGYLFKWLLIAGMVIAILVLFGGQILNYSNSKDQ